MGKLLYVKANAKPDGESRTFKISDSFIDSYRQTHPDDEIITLDLYKEDIHPLTNNDIKSVFGTKTDKSRQHPILKYTYQFAEADKYVIAQPLWNLSFPAILKIYIDYICIPGITFKYTENGSVGLCHGKKAINITSRGGIYSKGTGAELEMSDKYLRKIFAFMGIKDFTTICAEGLDIIGNDVEEILNKTIAEAKATAKTF